MKTLHRLSLLLWILWLGLPAAAQTNDPNTRVIRLLTTVQIPELRFQNADLEEVLRHLVQVSREADPEGIGFNLVYLAPKPGQHLPPPVTLDVRGLSLGEALRLVTQLTGQTTSLEKGILRVGLHQNQKTETRFYSVDPAQFNQFVDRAQKR